MRYLNVFALFLLVGQTAVAQTTAGHRNPVERHVAERLEAGAVRLLYTSTAEKSSAEPEYEGFETTVAMRFSEGDLLYERWSGSGPRDPESWVLRLESQSRNVKGSYVPTSDYAENPWTDFTWIPGLRDPRLFDIFPVSPRRLDVTWTSDVVLEMCKGLRESRSNDSGEITYRNGPLSFTVVDGEVVRSELTAGRWVDRMTRVSTDQSSDASPVSLAKELLFQRISPAGEEVERTRYRIKEFAFSAPLSAEQFRFELFNLPAGIKIKADGYIGDWDGQRIGDNRRRILDKSAEIEVVEHAIEGRASSSSRLLLYVAAGIRLLGFFFVLRPRITRR